MVLQLLIVGVGTSAFLYICRWAFTRKWINVNHDPILKKKSLKGKTIIITGANTGLGKLVAFDLAKRGADEVILACRNIIQGDEVVRSIIESTRNENVKCMLLDLASLESIRNFVIRFKEDYKKLDCLICNAGVWVPMEKSLKSADGYEIHFAVNHLGHFSLVKQLSDHLHEANDSRVVVVSSGLMMSGQVNIDNIDIINGRTPDPEKKRRGFAPTGYCDSKLMNGLFVKELAKTDKKITALAVCPGWCKTNLARHVNIPFYRKLLMLPFMLMFMRTCTQGANNIIFAAIQDKDKLENGGFYRDENVQNRENNKLESLEEQGVSSQLWHFSETLI